MRSETVLPKRFEAFVKGSPSTVMLRGTLEFACSDDFLDQIFCSHAVSQYEGELLFSTAVKTLKLAVCGTRKSVNAAYLASQEQFQVSVISLYNKLKNVEVQVSRALVRETSALLKPLMQKLGGRQKGPFAGYCVKILDGNHIAGTERRVAECRKLNARPLPGFAIAVLEPQWMLVTDVFPCEDAHAQERSVLEDVLSSIRPKDMVIADRMFCTTEFLFGIVQRRGAFVIRQHGNTLQNKELIGRCRFIGNCETGKVYEQELRIRESTSGQELVLRRITIELDKPTSDGETTIAIVTNLPKRISAIQIAEGYRHRWKIENVFQEISQAFESEINTLCYPKAALLCLCVAFYTYNIVSIVKAAMQAAHPEEITRERISGYYLAEEASAVYQGMMIAIPPQHWKRAFGSISPQRMARLLIWLAKPIQVDRFRKNMRGPKKPRPHRTGSTKHHIATARILMARRKPTRLRPMTA